MKIEVGKLYVSRNGCLVKIYELNVNGTEVFGAINIQKNWQTCSWNKTGEFFNDGEESVNDIVAEYKEPLDFDWSVLPIWNNYIAKCNNGVWFGYCKKPIVTDYEWKVIGISIPPVYIPLEYAPKHNTDDWKDSLYQRPKNKE